jgi:hypothetical protein
MRDCGRGECIARIARGRTFEELARDCLVPYPRPTETLARVMRELVAEGVVDLDSATGVYTLNGRLDPETVAALRQLELPDVDEHFPLPPLIARESAGRRASCFPELLGRVGR